MILLCDTRQQKGKHDKKDRWFRMNGIEVIRSKLYVGDYTLPTNQSICVDTKKDFQEIIGNLVQHDRLAEEADNARKAGIHLVFLVENDGGEVKKGSGIYNPVIRDISEVHKWKNPRLFIMQGRKQKYPKATKGITLQKMMYTFSEHHGCEFQFCTSWEAGKRIIEILGAEKKYG